MADYSIWVLEYSYVTKYHKSGVLYGAHNEGYVKLPYCYALIKGKNHVAMVDVGYNNKEYGKAVNEAQNIEIYVVGTGVPNIGAGALNIDPKQAPRAWYSSPARRLARAP